jgi:hypothetical protein
MRIQAAFLTIVLALGFAGCSKEGGATAPAGIEGTYVEQDSPDIQLILKGDKYQIGAKDTNDKGKFTARKLDENTYELEMVSSNPDFKDLNHQHTLTRKGDRWTLKEITTDGTIGDEQTFKKK